MAFNWFCRPIIAAMGIALGTSAALAADTPPQAPPRSIGDITALLDQYKPDPAKAAEVRKILDQAPPETQDRKDLARFYKQKALAAENVGAAVQFVAAMRKVVELGGEWDYAEDLSRLAQAERMAGNLQEVVAAFQQVLDRIPASGSDAGRRIAVLGQASRVHAQLGDFERAVALDKQLHSEFRSLRSPNVFNRWHLNAQHGLVLEFQGKLAEAESHLRAASELNDEIARQALQWRARRESTSLTEGMIVYMTSAVQTYLARIVAAQGRTTEAELIARSALSDAVKRLGRYSFYTAVTASPYLRILLLQGRYAEAEQLARAALEIFRNVGTPGDSGYVFEVRSDLGIALVAQRRYRDALAEFTAMRAAFATMPSLQVQLARGNAHWALALIETGDPAAAITMLDGLIASSRQWMGADHPDTATLVALRAMALARAGQAGAALPEFRSAQSVLIADALAQGDEASPLKTQTLTLLLEAYLRLLGEVRGTPIEQSAKFDAANEAFRIADLLRGQSTQQAVVASAARAAANDPLIGKEIRRQQDLQHESAALFRILRDLMMSPPEQQLPKVMADMQRRIESIRSEQRQLDADLAKRFPAYANLIRPQPPSLAEARTVLRPGEALLNIFSAPGASYVWAMKKDGPVAFAVVPMNREQVAARVSKLRSALDPGDVDIARALPRFELDTGFELYSQLLGPVAAGWQGATSLLVAANGALGQLPLALLPTQKAALAARKGMPYAEYTDVPWLIRQMAVTQLPSVNALVVLRNLPAGSVERSPFVGFGDPLFGKEQVATAGARKLRNATITRSTPGSGADPTASTDWLNYSAIPPLPDTRDEILSLAATLKADTTKDVFLGAEASKANVKKLDLSKRRIVAFATHGLLPNDFPGVNEPSLALANPNDGRHGLLTLEDILGLKLDADWVVLSACNTAAGDGAAADAVSGLGRGFFYAGTRALLVTHWPVESVSARLLVTGLFDRQAKDATLSRAQALRQSMLALMGQDAGSFSYAHPLFWAPYALVGDGGG